MEKQQNKDFENIDYGEILDYKEKEKDPLLFAEHFRCTTDWENKNYVRDDHGDIIPWEAAFEAILLTRQQCYDVFAKRAKLLRNLAIIACAVNILAAIIHFIRF
jgi:hypothetical protein